MEGEALHELEEVTRVRWSEDTEDESEVVGGGTANHATLVENFSDEVTDLPVWSLERWGANRCGPRSDSRRTAASPGPPVSGLSSWRSLSPLTVDPSLPSLRVLPAPAVSLLSCGRVLSSGAFHATTTAHSPLQAHHSVADRLTVTLAEVTLLAPDPLIRIFFKPRPTSR